MKKRILLTGTTGFVGSHLSDLLLEDSNNEIFGLKHWNIENIRNVAHIMDKINWIDCDITDPISTQKAIEKSNPIEVYHLAAESAVQPSWDHPSHYMDVNFNGTVNLLEAIRRMRINPRFLIAGSGEEYGEIKEEEIPITEQTQLRPTNPYAVTKIAQDLIGDVYHRSFGLNVIRTRAFNHEGPRRDKYFGIPWFAYQIAKIEQGEQESVIEVGHIEDRRNFTHIKDLVKAYHLAMEHCIPGELYLIRNENPKYVRPTNVPRLIGDSSKFTDLTNWKPEIPFNQILSDTLDYWREFVEKKLY